MIREAIDRILEIGQIQTFNIDNRKFSSRPLCEIKEPVVDQINMRTLIGFIDYILERVDSHKDFGKLVIHLRSPNHVVLVSHVNESDLRRLYWCNAEHYPDDILLGQYRSIEDMIILLTTHFQKTDDLPRAIALLGNIKDEKVVVSSDDGLTQTVTARSGIAMVKEVNVPNLLTLAPNRTFREISQPESPFLLRLRSGNGGGLPTAALFETDGGAWALAAMDAIKDYIEVGLLRDDIRIPIIM